METTATPSKVAVALNPVAAALNPVTVALNPVPGFCVKSRAANNALVHLTSSSDGPHALHVDKGLKIFVNVTWDPNVPPPPPANDDAIHRAMHGLDIDDSSPEAWFVPVVLSDARKESDKAGQPAIVFDCVLNPSIKSRTLTNADFKSFIIELVFQQIEAQTTLILSRQIATPNITSKGKPQPRRVLVPTTLHPPDHPHLRASPALVQEVPDHSTSVLNKAPPKGILKTTLVPTPAPRIPAWTWTQQGSRIRIDFDVPGVTRAVVLESTLDLEPRRIVLHIPALYNLDLDLDASDAELTSVFGKNNTANEALRLKHVGNLDVDNARAEWRVGDKAIVLWA